MTSENSSARIEHASLAAAVEQAANGFLITGVDGNIQYVNPAFTAMTGYTSDEVVGQNPRFLKSGCHPETFYTELWRTLLSGKTWQGEVINRRKDGSLYPEEMRIAPVRGADGETIGYVAIKHDVTERSAAHEAQAFLAAIVENSRDSIIACGLDGIVRSFNRGAEAIFGYAAEEVIGRHMSMLVPPERHEALENLARKLLRGESVSQYEGYCLRKDGCTLQVSVSGFPVKNSAGEVIAISNILRDITEQKRFERKHRENEERFRGIFEYAPSGMCVAEMDGRFVQVNEALCRILKYSAEELLRLSWTDLIHPDDLSSSLEKKKRVSEQPGEYAEDEHRNIDRLGNVVWVRVRVSLLKANGDGPGYFLAHVEDITERKKAAQALRESEERFRDMADSSPSMMWVTGPTGQIEFINQLYRNFSGTTSEEARDGKLRLLLHPEDAPAYLEAFDRAIRERAPFSAEGRVMRADGEWRIIGSRGEPRFSPSGEYLGHIGLRADITERKKAEQDRQFQHSLIRTTFDQSLHGILVVNDQGRIVSFNEKYFDLWRIPIHDVLHEPFDPAKGALDQPLLTKVTKRVSDPDSFLKRVQDLYANPDLNDECEIELKDGRTLERYSTSLRNEGGGYLARVWFFRDITGRKQAEQALHESEQRFRIMADGCPMPLWVTNAVGEIQFINRTLREFAGVVSEQIEGDKWHMFCHPDDAQQFIGESMRTLREHLPLKTESRFKRGDGQWRWLAVNAEPHFSPSGEFLGHIGLGTDITERKQVEQERRFQNSLIRAIFESSLDGILVVNSEGVVVSHNKRLLDIWRISATEASIGLEEEIVGTRLQPIESVVLDRVENPQIYLKRIKELDDDSDSTERTELELKNGRTLERYSANLRGQGGEFLGRARFFSDITERKRAERALRESEEQFRIMADCCPMGIWVTDGQGNAMFANLAYRRFCGITSMAVDPHAGLSIIHDEDAPAFIEAFNRSLREHTPFEAEQRSRRADGEWRWLESYAEPRFSTSGEFMGLVGTSKDITDRKQAEQALQSSEERFRQLTENIREVFWLKEPGSDGFLYVSPAYEQVWGRSCESFYENPESRVEAIHPDDLIESRAVFARQMQGEAVETEYRIETPDGQKKWIRNRAFPIHDQDGKLIRVAGIAEDITERKLHEQELMSAQATAEAASRRLTDQHAILDKERKILRTIIDNVPDFMYVKDIESKFIVANSATAELMGAAKPEDLLGKTDFDFYPGELATSFFEGEQQVIRTGEAMVNREETVGADATDGDRYFLSTKVPLFDSEGHVTGIAGIGRDITLRKTIQNALEESNRELQEATDWANKLALEAEEANRSKSEFLANMSHEIRTPMNGVLGMNGLLLGTDLNSEQRHFAELVDASARALLTVIDDILDYSKVEAGKMELDTMDFNLHVLMGDLAEMMAERVGDKRLEFICAVAPEVTAHLQGDPGRLRQVLLNLISNALKFTRQGEVVARVSLISETDTEVLLRFAVRDTGIGIPLDKQKILFTSFTQVDASTTRQYGGTGLGLAISKKLVELMGGGIGLESKEGVGSEFWFTIHLAKQVNDRSVDYPKVPLKGTRILVVDDNATNREVITAQLQSWGALVAAVESGSTALTCLRYAVEAGSPFQLAVLDMMMPLMDGETLGRAILEDETLRSIPLVMMTSLGQRGDAHRFKEIGFAAYLIKPVRQSDLYDCLVEVLTGEKQREATAIITRHSLREQRRAQARILLVEDNTTNQEVAGGMLRRLGWHADVAGDGLQAVKALEAQFYDLVLMDVQMPVMDGYEASRLIRDPDSAVLNHNVPIIATTAHVMTGDAEKCLAAGMSDYISKPIDPKILSKVVEKWLVREVHRVPGEAPVERAWAEPELPLKLSPRSPVFNREAFLDRMMGDTEFALEVVAGFVSELSTLLSELKEEFARGDLQSIWKQAHKIKGSAANVGGEALRDVALEIEQAGKAGDMASAARCIPELEIQTTRLKDELQRWAK